MVVSNIFYVHPYLGKISIWTNIFSDGLKPPASTALVLDIYTTPTKTDTIMTIPLEWTSATWFATWDNTVDRFTIPYYWRWFEQSFDFTRSELDGCKHWFSPCSPAALLKMIQFRRYYFREVETTNVFDNHHKEYSNLVVWNATKSSKKIPLARLAETLWVEVSVEVTLGSEFLSYHIM